MEKDRKNYLPKVKILRERLCIGLQDGIDLLKQTEGNVEAASVIFKEKILHLTLSVIKLPPEQITPYLEKYKYDAGRAIDALLDAYQLVDGIPQPEPVYILHKFRHYRKEAIAKIAALIEQREKRSRKWQASPNAFPWFKGEALTSLDPFARCVVVLHEWLEYEDTASFEEALFYHLDLVAVQLRFLQLPDLAAALCMARDIYKELFDRYTYRSPEFYTALRKDEDFTEARKYFEESRSLLTDKLYDFIRENLERLSL